VAEAYPAAMFSPYELPECLNTHVWLTPRACSAIVGSHVRGGTPWMARFSLWTLRHSSEKPEEPLPEELPEEPLPEGLPEEPLREELSEELWSEELSSEELSSEELSSEELSSEEPSSVFSFEGFFS